MAWLIAHLLFASFSASGEDQWFCKEGASRRLGDVLETCGIAKSKDEAVARKKALEGAFDEFNTLCEQSVDCRDYEKTVEPMRTECLKGKDSQFTCYRALDFTVTHHKKEKEFKDQDKKDQIVSAISQNEGVNPLVDSTSAPPPDQTTTIYNNIHYRVHDPFVYVIGSQPQVVYMRSQLPPHYVVTPPPPPPPPPRNKISRADHTYNQKKSRSPHKQKKSPVSPQK